MQESQRSLIKYYEDMLDLFTHPGWQALVQEMETEINHLEKGIFDSNKEAFDYNKGVYKTLKRFVTLPLMVEQGYSNLEDTNANL